MWAHLGIISNAFVTFPADTSTPVLMVMTLRPCKKMTVHNYIVSTTAAPCTELHSEAMSLRGAAAVNSALCR